MNGNPTRIQDVLGRVFNKVYDANGNVVSATDGKGQATTYACDEANQRTSTVDRTGTNKWTYFYTPRGKLDHVTDPLGNVVANTYDAANRLIRVTDPLGQSVTNQYDPNGNLFAFFDKLSQRWIKTHDRLNRITSETDPLGNTRTTSYDVADRIQQITSPNGYPSTHAYDGRGRLTKWVDPQNFSWLYAYDGVGNITNITDALAGHYIMAYGPCNERILEQNQDTNRWNYAYDELLRLRQQTNPNGVVRTPTYDAAGRRLFVDFSTGRRDSFVYDDNDNPKTVSRRLSGVTTAIQFIYDSLDRAVEQDDALGKTVLYGYDPLGRTTSITYPGGKVLANSYDALGRLTNQVDWVGWTTRYAYDAGNRLIFRRYPNGVVQTNAFDTAGRITGLTYAPTVANSNSISIALTYAYDRNGNKVGGGESGTLAWPLPSLTDDNTAFTAAGRMKTRQTVNNSAISNQTSTISYSYDASGNMTNATGGGQSWALTYDEDNRTTSIHWDAGVTSKQVTNRYDALGRRVSKTVDGVTTGYVLSLAGGMERVLCDLDGAGNVTAWYVHGADLCYKVDATNGLTCYHADAMANVIALTDGGTNLVAQFAYTPYGRSLGSTNFQAQVANPYLLVGSQGVMEEVPGLYFMRARYYSADAGVFLSTDPVKKIGPGWTPVAYTYADNNPIRKEDPLGLSAFSRVVGGLSFIGEFISPVNLGYILGGDIAYAAGYLAHNQTMMHHALGTLSLPYQNAISDLEAVNQTKIGFGNFNDSLSASQFSDSPQMYQDLNGLMVYANLATAVVDVGQGVTVLRSGTTGIMSLAKPAAGLITDIAGFLPTKTQESQPTGGGSSGNQSMSGATVGAMCYASAVSGATATPRANPTTPSASTASGGMCVAQSSGGNGNSGSSGGHGTPTQNGSTGSQSSPTSFIGQVGSFLSNVASSIGSIFSHFHWP